MALIKCPECNKEISDKATTCIHCGYPLPVENITKDVENKMADSIVSSTLESKNVSKLDFKNISKRLKISMVISVVLIIGVILVCSKIAENVRIAEPRVHFNSNTEMSEVLESGKWWQTYKGQNLGFCVEFDGSIMTFTDAKGEFDTSIETYTLDYENSTILRDGRFRFDVIELNGNIYLRQNPKTEEKSWVLFKLY